MEREVARVGENRAALWPKAPAVVAAKWALRPAEGEDHAKERVLTAGECVVQALSYRFGNTGIYRWLLFPRRRNLVQSFRHMCL